MAANPPPDLAPLLRPENGGAARIGASGARIVVTLPTQLKQRGIAVGESMQHPLPTITGRPHLVPKFRVGGGYRGY
jgi:hypothetical protein